MFLRQTKSSCPLRSSLGSLYPSLRLHIDHMGEKDLLTVMWWGQKGCQAQKRNVIWGSPCPDTWDLEHTYFESPPLP